MKEEGNRLQTIFWIAMIGLLIAIALGIITSAGLSILKAP